MTDYKEIQSSLFTLEFKDKIKLEEKLIIHKIKRKSQTHIFITNYASVGIYKKDKERKYYQFKFLLSVPHIEILKNVNINISKIPKLFDAMKVISKPQEIVMSDKEDTKSEKVMISYVMLDDLQYMEDCILTDGKPFSKEILRTYDNIYNFIMSIADKYIKYESEYDAAHFFKSNYYGNITDSDIADITNTLLEEGYYVRNRLEKYYVVAFSINFSRFEVYSKDCDKEVIDWGVTNQGPIVGRITNPDYNENPVLTLMRSIYPEKN